MSRSSTSRSTNSDFLLRNDILTFGVMWWIMLAGGFAHIVFPVKVGEIGTGIVAAPGILLSFAVVFLLIGGFLSFKAYGRD